MKYEYVVLKPSGQTKMIQNRTELDIELGRTILEGDKIYEICRCYKVVAQPLKLVPTKELTIEK